MGIVVYALRERVDGIPLVAEFLLLILAGVLAYGAVILGLERRFGIGLDRLYRIVHEWAH